jgi:tRNA modification GTPase
MPYDANDTIVAIASPPGPAARGIIRLAGPAVPQVLAACGLALPAKSRAARRFTTDITVEGEGDDSPFRIPGHLYIWPTNRSYARQPSAEFHTIGSPPLLAAIVEQFTRAGARVAEPGEFTLRAFLAGRIDLTQAEAVLGVIDARGQGELDDALDQLAGGLSRPLHQLRERLLSMLADLEAGLDFVEEDIEFIRRDDLSRELASAHSEVAALISQMRRRDAPATAPRVALVGPPNAGKSSLFNALVDRFGKRPAAALVSPEPGVTRDWLVARLKVDGVEFDLIDTAGHDESTGDGIHHAAQKVTEQTRQRADMRLHCIDVTMSQRADDAVERSDATVITKIDLRPAAPAACGLASAAICTSATTGEGIESLAHEIACRLQQLDPDTAHLGAASSATARTLETLAAAEAALAAAGELTSVESDAAGDDLVAAELRLALAALAQVTGAATTEDLLDVIFSKFCIGK